MNVHIIRDDKFTEQLVIFINQHFKDNIFLIFSPNGFCKYSDISRFNNSVFILSYNIKSIWVFLYYIYKSKKIFLHGMVNKLIIYLIFGGGISSKCYWCIWGGDLYGYKKERGLWKLVKTRTIRKLAGIVTQIEGDYELARDVYGTNCKYYHCLLYMSNTLSEYVKGHLHIRDKKINVLVGHYADKSAEHEMIINALASEVDIYFHLPISYGNLEYADYLVDKYANDLNRVKVYRDFMESANYYKMLDLIDIAIFPYKRQQACGNIIQLLGRGVTVYLNPSVTTWKWLVKLGIHIKDVQEIFEGKISLLSLEEQKENMEIISKYASKENLEKQWAEVL